MVMVLVLAADGNCTAMAAVGIVCACGTRRPAGGLTCVWMEEA